MAKYIVKSVLHFPDGINEGQITVDADSEQEAIDVAIEKLKRIWSIAEHSITIKSATRRGTRMATDENTEGTDKPVKEKSSMDEQSKKIKAAGIEETPAGQELEEEETAPEPKGKTPAELAESPHEALDIDGGAPDPLSVDITDQQKNPEQLEWAKDRADRNDTQYNEPDVAAVKKYGARMAKPSPGEEVYSEENYHGHVITVVERENHFEVVVDGQQCHSSFNSGASAKAEGRRLCDTGEYLNLMKEVNVDILTRMGVTQTVNYRNIRYEITYEKGKGFSAKALGDYEDVISPSSFTTEKEAKQHARIEIDGYLDE